MRTDIRAITVESIDVTGGFWYEKQKLVREVSMDNVYKRFYETGRFDAFKFKWKEGDENKPHVYWDSDVAKWIEAVGYISEKHKVPRLEAIADEVIDDIERNRMADGYFNSYFGHLEPDARFTRRNDHELYCLGHLIEAAIAYKHGTGKDKLLKMMIEYANLVYRVFYVEKSAVFLTPGHEELELALVKLYKETGDKKYLELSLYFVDVRGTDPVRDEIPGFALENLQGHAPVRRQTTAEGHSVRAGYLFSAVADLAKECNDEELFNTAKTVFNNIAKRRMYVTGAIGQNPVGEAFSEDFDLPNQTAYAETCATLSLALFARRMSLIDPKSIYADIAEKAIYNAFISGMSLDGKSFFYSNMQENDLQVRRRIYGIKNNIFRPADTRVEVFKTSCCPPNVVRAVSAIQDFQYSTDGSTVFCHQYFETRASFDGKTITMATEYPYDGAVKINYEGKASRFALRIPGWCKDYTILKNGTVANGDIIDGYFYLDIASGDELLVSFDMPIRFLEAHPKIWVDCGKIAVSRGPIIFCIEGVDNDYPVCDVRLDKNADFKLGDDPKLGVPVLDTVGYIRDWDNEVLYGDEAKFKQVPVRLIPYLAFANRGSTDMVIWTMKK